MRMASLGAAGIGAIGGYPGTSRLQAISRAPVAVEGDRKGRPIRGRERAANAPLPLVIGARIC
jgi:hypothetical protein